MSKKSKMQWGENDLKELQKVVKNFNAKLYRIQKKNPDADYLPSKISKKELVKHIETRADFEFLVKTYKGFSKRGAEKPVKSKKAKNPVGTKWEANLKKKFDQRLKKKKDKEREILLDKPQLVSGKPTGATLRELYDGKAGMHSIAENKLEHRPRDIDKMNRSEFKKNFLSLEKQFLDKVAKEKMELFKDNYIKSMIREGYSDEMINFIKGLPADLMAKTVQVDANASIDFVYDKSTLENREKQLREVWSHAMNREKYTQKYWKEFLKENKPATHILSSLIENVELRSTRSQETVWAEIIKYAGYADEIIKYLV